MGIRLPAVPVLFNPGNSTTCTRTYTTTAADVTTGSKTNTAVANALFGSTNVTSNNASETIHLARFTLAKESATSSTGPWGESVTVNLGAPVYYRIQLNNNGSADLTGISIDDGMVDCTLAGPGASDTNGDSFLNPGEIWEYTCSVTAVGGSHTNTASADTDQTSPLTDTAAYYGMEPSLSIDKNHTGSFVRGSTASYSLVVSNASGAGISQTLGTVTVSDTLPTGLTLTGTPTGSGWTCTGTAGGTTLSCTRSDTLAPGASYPAITVLVNVLESAVDPATNTATVSGGGDPSDSSDSDITTITSVADLSLYKSVDNATPDVLSNVVFTVSVYNSGPSTASGVSVLDLLPAGLAYVSDDGGGTYNPGTGIWTVGSIAYGATTTLHITATVTGTISITNWAEVWTSGASDPDSTPGNNSTTEDDDDSATISPQSHPSLTISKNGVLDMTVVAPGTRADAGDVINYTITITNIGNIPLTSVYVSDPLLSNIDCDSGVPGNQNTNLTIPVSGSLSCSGSYSLTQPDLNSNGGGDGDIDNTATTDSAQTSPQTASAAVPITLDPQVTATKTASPTSIPEPGGSVTFTYRVENTGNVALTITSLEDDIYGSLSGDADCHLGSVISPGDFCEFSLSDTIFDAADTTHTNVFTIQAQDGLGGTSSDNDAATVTITAVPPTVSLTKTVTPPATLAEPGGSFEYTLTVLNTSIKSVTITDLTDDNSLSASCLAMIGTDLGAGGSVSCTYTVNRSEAGVYPNTADVTVVDAVGEIASDDASASVTVTDVLPSVTLDKSVDIATLPEPGGTFTYTLTITNNSVEAVSITALTDSNTLSTDCTNLIGDSLAAGATASCTYTVNHTEPGTYNNTASVTVTDNEGNPATDTDSESVSVTNVAPAVDLVKSVTPASRPEPGGSFDYTLTITNNSVEQVTITALSDDNPLPAGCTSLVGTTLAAGASTSCTYSVTHSEAGTYPNTASVTVQDNEGGSASDSDSQSVSVTDVLPSVTLDKTVTPASRNEPGGSFDYTLTITNNSVETVTITALTDSNALPADCTDLIGDSLAPGASTSCTYSVSYNEAGIYGNTASVTVADNEGNPATSTDSASVTVTDVLPSVTLDKSVDIATLPEPGGTFTYTLTITNNSVEAVSITALTDSNTLSTDCTNLIGDSLAAGATASCTYTVNHTEPGTYNNTASVTVTDNEGNPATDTDSESVSVTNVAPAVDLVKSVTPASRPEPGGSFDYTLTITNNSVEQVTITALSDDNPLPAGCTSLVGTTLAAGASTSCTYSVTHSEAGTYPNTASVTVQDNEGGSASDSDSQSVSVTDVLPNVVLTKSASPVILPIPGGDFIFTLVIANNGLEDFIITSLTDSNSVSTDFSNCLALIGDTLVADSTVSCTYTVNHNSVDTYDNTANVSVSDNEGNSASDSDTETVEVTDVVADLSIAKSDSPDPVGVNQEITYTLIVANLGTDEALNVSVVDDLPSEATYVSSSGSGWTCSYDVPTHSVTCTRGNLAIGTAPDITITVTAPSSPTTLQNTATVSARSSDPILNNNTDSEETLVVQSDPDALVKTLEDTSEDFTSGTNVAIGEVLTYQVVITVPPGTFDTAQLVDTLGQGLAFVACDSIVAGSTGLTTNITGGFSAICNDASVAEYTPGSTELIDQGRHVTYDLGTLMNTTTGDITLTVTYRAVVLDALENQDGDTLNNSAEFSWDENPPLQDSADPVTVLEPDLSIQKSATPSFVRVGDIVTYTITIHHTDDSNTNAYDTLMQDVVPVELGIILPLNCNAGGQSADTCAYDAGTRTVAAGWDNFTLTGGTGVVRFQATVLSLPPQGGVTNTAAVEWTSLPGVPEPSPNSQYNDLSTERFYDPQDPANNYGTEASFTLNALSQAALPATGFAPGVVTDISKLPKATYSQNGNLALEIPSLKLSLPILGIPLLNGNWDLTWLAKQAGWLQGTAYPTYDGNSVLTAHVYLPNGQRGPFIDLGKLSWGQEIAVVSNGSRYVYQVREVKRIKPDDMSVFKHEEKSWLTLLTCKEYDEKTNTYRSRLMVRAVLVRVEDIKK